jgi:hypothetical protein
MGAAVDEFVKRRVQPEHRDVVARLRALIAEWAPGAREELTYGILAWRNRRIVAVVSPTKKDVTLAFSRGAELVDRHGLLRGVGKVSKHVKIKSVDDMDEDALRDYVNQALELDSR